MPKLFLSATLAIALITPGFALVTPGFALAQMSESSDSGPPAKTATFNGGNMTNGSAAQSGAGAKVVGTGTNGPMGNDTPAKTTTGSMGNGSEQSGGAAGGSATPSSSSQ